MSVAQGAAAQSHHSELGDSTVANNKYWLVTVLRALPAIAVGLTITFLEDHSARVGLISFGAFAASSGAIVLVGALRNLTDRVVRGIFVTHGVVALGVGVAAVLLWNTNIAVLLLLITVFAALTGALEAYAGLRARGAMYARDWATVGIYTAVAAIVFVLIPPEPVLTTGLIGAYGMILGVFLVIAGLSQKWSLDKPSEIHHPTGTDHPLTEKASE